MKYLKIAKLITMAIIAMWVFSAVTVWAVKDAYHGVACNFASHPPKDCVP